MAFTLTDGFESYPVGATPYLRIQAGAVDGGYDRGLVVTDSPVHSGSKAAANPVAFDLDENTGATAVLGRFAGDLSVGAWVYVPEPPFASPAQTADLLLFANEYWVGLAFIDTNPGSPEYEYEGVPLDGRFLLVIDGALSDAGLAVYSPVLPTGAWYQVIVATEGTSTVRGTVRRADGSVFWSAAAEPIRVPGIGSLVAGAPIPEGLWDVVLDCPRGFAWDDVAPYSEAFAAEVRSTRVYPVHR